MKANWKKRGIASLGTLLLLLLLVWALGQELLLQRWLPWALNRLTHAQVGTLHGSLWGTLRLERLDYRDAQQVIHLQQLELQWQPWQLLRGRLQLQKLALARVDFASFDQKPATLPQTLALPWGLDLQADQISIAELHVGQGLTASAWRNIHLGLRSEQGAWTVAQAGLDSAWGQFSAQGKIQHLAPFALQAKVSANLPAPAGNALLEASGNLQQLQLTANLPQHAGSSLRAVLAPFAPDRLQALEIDARHLDFRQLNPAWPQLDLSLSLQARQTNGVWSGQLLAQNGLSGSVDAQRLPLQKIAAQIGGRANQLQLNGLLIDLGPGGQWQGQLQWDSAQPGKPTVQLHSNNLNLQALHARMRPSKIAAKLDLTGPEFSLALAQQDLQLELQARLEPQHLVLRQARLRSKNSELDFSGQLDNWQDFAVKGQLRHFNPANFGQFPQADLNSQLQLQGRLQPQWQLAGHWQLSSSQLLGQALSGHGQVKLDGQHLQQLDLELRLADNFLRAKGALGGAQDRVQWQADWHALTGFGWDGAIAGKGELRGNLAQVQMQYDVQTQALRRVGLAPDAARLQLQGQFDWHGASGTRPAWWQLASRINMDQLNPASWGAFPQALLSGQGNVQLDSLGALKLALQLPASRLAGQALSGKIDLDLDAQQIHHADVVLNWATNRLSLQQAPGASSGLQWQLDAPQLPGLDFPFSASGSLQGNRAAHSLLAQVKFSGNLVDGKIAGGWQDGQGWRGQIQQLRSGTQWALLAPAPLEWRSSAQELALQALRIKFDGGELALEKLGWHAGEWQARGQARAVPLAWVGTLAPVWRARLAGGLRMNADWDLALGQHLNGSVHLQRDSGDIQPGPEFPKGLGLSTLKLEASMQQDAVKLDVALQGQQLGQAQLQLETRLSRIKQRWGLLGSSPLRLQASAKLDSIAPLAWIGNQAGWQYGGSLAMQVQGQGTLNTPNLQGTVSGDNLSVRWINEGLVLRNGVLRADWLGQTLQIKDLHFDGVKAQGQLQVAQTLPWSDRSDNALADNPRLEAALGLHLNLQAQQLPVISRPDRLLVVSGQAWIDLDAQGLRLNGKLIADRALIEWQTDTTPTLSADIRIVRGGQLQKAASAPLRSQIALELDLGPQFQIKGQGLDARIGGSLQWRTLGQRGPRLTGNILVEQGSYRAYGQNLRIERGVLNFTGAWDNPGLNILALRPKNEKESEVEVGVEVRGNVLNPQVRLISTPPLPDSEKLAWLVLGHGLEGAQGQELDVLGAASSAFFGQTRNNVANRLGLDELGVAYARGLENTVITVGKRISSRAYLSFDQGVGSATGLVKLRYTLNPRVSIQAQTGSNNALDIFYSWRFD